MPASLPRAKSKHSVVETSSLCHFLILDLSKNYFSPPEYESICQQRKSSESHFPPAAGTRYRYDQCAGCSPADTSRQRDGHAEKAQGPKTAQLRAVQGFQTEQRREKGRRADHPQASAVGIFPGQK